MTLLSPWWLLLVPTLYLIVILHTLHPQRDNVLVPSILLWQRVVKELAADARWRRIVANLLLLAQLCAITFLIVALINPAFLLSAARQRHDIIILDTSASMAATDVAPNRLQAVKQKVLEHVRNERPRQITLINAGPNPTIVYNGRTSFIAVRAALQKMPASGGTADWDRAAVLARSTLSSTRGQILIATDGALNSTRLRVLSEITKGTPIRTLSVTGNGNNVGITAFDARQAGDSLAQFEVLVTLANYSPSQMQVPLTLRTKQSELGRRLVTVPPGEKRNEVFYHTFKTTDVLTAEIELNDSLAMDNQAYLTAYPPTPTRVLLVGPGSYYLEKGLRVFPQVRLERRLIYPEGSTYPLVIFDRMPIPDDFTGTALYIAGAADDRALGVRTTPQVTWWDRTHPLTRFVNWQDLGLEQAFLLPRLEGAQVLVESEAGPTLQLIRDNTKRVLVLSFSLEDTDWPFKVAFPLFLSHLLEWAHPEGWSFIRQPLAPGDSLELPQAFQSEKGWLVRRPDGEQERIAASPGAVYTNTMQPGLYAVVSDKDEFPFAVNSGTDEESNIRPRLQLPSAVDADISQPRLITHAPIWWPFAFLAFLLLLAEGWLYTHKVRRPVNVRFEALTTLLKRLRHTVTGS